MPDDDRTTTTDAGYMGGDPTASDLFLPSGPDDAPRLLIRIDPKTGAVLPLRIVHGSARTDAAPAPTS